jgi:hypothetical protein
MNEMNFIYLNDQHGWYPDIVNNSSYSPFEISTISAILSDTSLILHDFLDHGPERRYFIFDEEVEALGSSAWTKIVPINFVGSDQLVNTPYWQNGFEKAKARFPNGVQLAPSFEERFREFSLRVVSTRSRSLRANFNITIFEKDGVVDFKNYHGDANNPARTPSVLSSVVRTLEAVLTSH